ncbi:MAG TPA: hypothetical protein VN257_02305 [Actinotalea sp.]|nr:hypothetical protein [Actinotalea sp.]
MTDRRPSRRGLVALAVVPLTAGAFGASTAWAGAHDPLAAAPEAAAAAPFAAVPVAQVSAGPAEPTPTEVLLGALSVEVADAQARVLALQATLDQRAADSAAAAAAQAARPAVSAARTSVASAPASASAPAAAPAPPPAPAVNTTTKASG